MSVPVASVFKTMSYPELFNSKSVSLIPEWLTKADQERCCEYESKDLNKARQATEELAWSDPVQRAALIFKLAQEVENRKDFFAGVESVASKKPVNRTKGRDIPELIRHLYNAAHAVAFCPQQWIPHGVVGVILEETNSPSLCQSMCVGPPLAAGNSVFLCGRGSSFYSANLLVHTALHVGFPAGVLNVLADVPDFSAHSFDLIVGSGLKPNANVLSTLRWKRISRTKAVVTECADLASAAHGVIQQAYFHAPMSSGSGVCVLVQESVYDSFWAELSSAVKKLRPFSSLYAPSGDFYFHLDDETQIAKRKQNITEAEKQGAEVVYPDFCSSVEHRPGPVAIRGILPTLSFVQNPQGPADCQIVWVQSFRHSKEAVTLANSAPLADYVSIWGEQTSVLLEIAKELQAQNVWINTQNVIDTAESLDTNIFLAKTEQRVYEKIIYEESVQKSPEKFVNELKSSVSLARAALKKWADLGSDARSQLLFSFASQLLSESEALKKISSAANTCFSEHIGYLFKFASQAAIPGLKPTVNGVSSAKCWNWISPRGVVGALLPNRGSFASLLTSLGAAVAAGNTFVALLDDLQLANFCRQVLSKSGLPVGVVNIVHADTFPYNSVGELLKADSDAVWVLTKHTKLDLEEAETLKGSFPVSYLDLSNYDWQKNTSEVQLCDWFQRQAVNIKKVWFDEA